MPILDTSLHSLKRIYRGKVRDSYELGDDKLLIIATDRISAFDVILEVDNIATIKDLIRRDFGISILARSTCYDELRKK